MNRISGGGRLRPDPWVLSGLHGIGSPGPVIGIALGLVMIFWPPARLESRPVKTSTFHYYREVRIPVGTGAAYGRVLLDEDTSLHSYGRDLRMTLDGQPVPYFVRNQEISASSKGNVTVLHRERTESTGIFVVQIAHPPEGKVPVELEVMSDSNFESGVRLQSGARPGEWHEAGHFSVYRYDESPGKIRLPDGGPYFRLEFDGKQNYTFPGVRYALPRANAEFRIVPGADWKQDYDSDEAATVFYYANPSHRKLSRITLQFKEDRYRRPITLYEFDRASKSYQPSFSALLFRKDGDSVQSIDFKDTVSDAIKIVIKNGDDEPLHLQEAMLFGPVSELVFQVPDAARMKEGAGLRIYYGNAYIAGPDFDLAQSFEPSLLMVDAGMGPEKPNEAFAYSIVEPPVSTWVIRILFLAGLAAIGFPAWRILSRYAERVRPV